jgi:hypothetical protein
MPTFARAYPKILNTLDLFFFNQEFLKTHHGRLKYYFFIHGTFWVVMAKGFSVKIRVC